MIDLAFFNIKMISIINKFKIFIVCLFILPLSFLSADPFGLQVVKTGGKTDSITQYGVTWQFDQEVEYGTFITGDYWVIGPVTVTSVSPSPLYAYGYYLNGSMINPPNGPQAYDSRSEYWGASYDGSYRVDYPVTVANNSSLVSTISVEPYDTPFRPGIQSASVLTVLASRPPEGSFRPGLIGNTKTLYNVNDIRWDLLPDLAPTPSFPSASTIAADYTRWFERPWLLHATGWTHRHSMPVDNSPAYHRYVALLLSQASVLCIVDWGDRTELVTNFLQVAIDYYAMQQNGNETGVEGAYNYRWPLVFAGLMLGDQDMMSIWKDGTYSTPSYHEPHLYYWEDQTRTLQSNIIPLGETWTYYNANTGKKSVFYGNDDGGDIGGHEQLDPSEWYWIAEAGYAVTEGGGAKSESYRRYHSVSIPGFSLAAYAFGMESYLAFPEYLDYADRWMYETEADMETYGVPVTDKLHKVQTSASVFVDEMWFQYRNNY